MNGDPQTERWEKVADVAELPPGASTRVSIAGEDIAIYNTGDGLYAIGDVCTHAEASLTDGDFYEDMRGWVAECPLHGSQFDVTTGEAISLPATGNVGKYAVKVEDGAVYVNPQQVTSRHE